MTDHYLTDDTHCSCGYGFSSSAHALAHLEAQQPAHASDKHPVSKGVESETTLCWREHRPGYVCILPEGHPEIRSENDAAIAAATDVIYAAYYSKTWGPFNAREVAGPAVAAVEPIIRAQAFADAAAVFTRTRDSWIAERGTPDWSFRAEWAYREGARVLSAWAEDPTRIDKTLEKIAAEAETEKP